MSFQIILGSASMARRQILTEMGYDFTVMTADIDEKSIRMDRPEELVMVLAGAKADAIISRMQSSEVDGSDETRLLITADTVVVYHGIIREKPSSKEEAWEFIKGYSGGNAGVVGSALVTNLKTGKRRGGWQGAEVYFHVIPDEIIGNIIEEGTTLKVAGSLMLEHPMISPFAMNFSAYFDLWQIGTTDMVMGLPKELAEKLIREAL